MPGRQKHQDLGMVLGRAVAVSDAFLFITYLLKLHILIPELLVANQESLIHIDQNWEKMQLFLLFHSIHSHIAVSVKSNQMFQST